MPVPILPQSQSIFPNGFLQGSELPAAESQPALTVIGETSIDEKATISLTTIPLATGDCVLFIGDSLMQGVAPHVKHALFTQWGSHSLDLSRQSTGIRYPAFFNWPKTVTQTLQKYPDIVVVVVFLGPNDPWGLPTDENATASPFKSERWEQRYRARIADILHIAQRHNAHVIWVGPPNTRDTTLSQGMQYQRPLYQSEVENAGEIYLDGNRLLQYSETGYTDTLVDEKGHWKVRTADGIHFTPKGQRILAKAIMSKLNGPDAEVASNHTQGKNNPPMVKDIRGNR